MANVPTVPDYTPTTAEDTVLNGQVVGTDLDSDPLTYSLGAQATNGVAVVNADGTYSYTPNANYNGTDSFTVIVADGVDGTATSTVTVTVTAVADAPVNTVPGAQTTAEDTALVFNGAKLISVNDVDGNLATTRVTVTNGILNVTLGGGATISAGANGSATLTLSGTQTQINAALATLTYTPTLNFNGAAVLTVLSTDATGTPLTDSDTVAITVTAVNDAPVNTKPTSVTTNEDTAFAFTAANTISVNDVDGNLATTRLTATNGIVNVSLAGGATISAGANGTATLTLSGTQVQINAALATAVYTPTLNFNGAATLTVLSTDAAGTPLTDSDVINITVTAVNDAPVNTVPGAQTTAEDTVLVFNGAKLISVNDVDGNLSTTRLTVTNGVVNVSLAGGATISAGANGSSTLTLSGTQVQINAALATLTYTPTANYNGAALLTVLSTDASSATDSDTVAITVTAVNDAPVVPNYSKTVVQDAVLSGAVVATDVEGTTLTYAEGVAPAHGDVVVNTDGTYEYTPTAGYVGADSFTVVASDGALSATSTVSVTVTELNVAPTIPNYTFEVDEGSVLSAAVVGSDANAGDTLIHTAAIEPTHGTLVVDPDGAFTYEPAADYFGPDEFTISVSDGALTANSVVKVTVLEVKEPPTVPNYNKTVAQGFVLNDIVVGTDPDSAQLSYAAGIAPTHGVLTVYADGSYRYAPLANYSGSDSFTVNVSDGTSTVASTVSVTVTAAPKLPAAVDNTATTERNTAVVITAATLVGDDTDPSGGTLTVASVQTPVNGTVAKVGTNITFTPKAGFEGQASFTYTAASSNGAQSSARVVVNVTAPTPPSLADVKAKITADETLNFDDFGVLYQAALQKLQGLVAQLQVLEPNHYLNYGNDDLTNSVSILLATEFLSQQIASVERKLADLTKGDVTEAQDTKMKALVTSIGL